MSKSKTLISLYWPDKFIHNFSEISSKSKSDLRWLWKIQATLVVTRQQTDFLGSENIKSRIFVKHRSMRCLKMVSSPRKLKNQYMNFKTMHNVYILLYFNVSRVIRQVQTTLCMKISQFQSKPDPIKLFFRFDFYELTLYFTTRGGDLWHTQVSGADDVIVTGSVPGLNIRKKHKQWENWWRQNTCFLNKTCIMLQKPVCCHIFVVVCKDSPV